MSGYGEQDRVWPDRWVDVEIITLDGERQMDEWQPAESAPRDGSVFLGTSLDPKRLFPARRMRWGIAERPDENYICNEGDPWWINEDGRHLAPRPTHWKPIESQASAVGMYQRFLTTVPRLLIGQRVRVVGECASDWPVECLVTGVQFDAVRGRWNISIMPKDEIEAEHGSTDGWSEMDLRLVPE